MFHTIKLVRLSNPSLLIYRHLKIFQPYFILHLRKNLLFKLYTFNKIYLKLAFLTTLINQSGKIEELPHYHEYSVFFNC